MEPFIMANFRNLILRLSLKIISPCVGFVWFSSICSFADALPPPPVYSPEEQLARFELAESAYCIELVASEPHVEDPVAMVFDGQGRLWVAEMPGFMRNIDREVVTDPTGRRYAPQDRDRDVVMDESQMLMPVWVRFSFASC